MSEGHLLDGRVRYAQPCRGFRSGIEPVLLAAAVPARSTDRVLEAGSGAGATLLCLAARVPGIDGLGVEIKPELVELARQNATANGWPGLQFIAADIGNAGAVGPNGIGPNGLGPNAIGTFDHACANPPYHSAGGSASRDADRELAKRSRPGLLTKWAGSLGPRLRHRGTLTMVLPAAELPAAMAALVAADCPPAAVLPLWPRAAYAAKLALVQGVKGGRGAFRLLPGLVLHRVDGSFTPETEAVLRGGAAIQL
ncbi:MAG TPA: methyltransferase domain-containing protein [Acetobacteraceae bacterium]|nr:methyltransferase domain-containing protein [Acetobacteraceae bacterium]